MPNPKRTVLITGCSDGSLGAGLAVAFHNAGLRVYATARNPTKTTQLKSLGIETLTLDVLSDSSIAACVSQLSSLDILVNNAGGPYNMPVSDISIAEAKKLFDLNVWSYITVTQAFLPLLLKSKGMIVNQTSCLSATALPFQSAYSASKAAMAMFSLSQRLELAPFGITVVDLKTGVVKSNIISKNIEGPGGAVLPDGSIYEPAKETVERVLRGDEFKDGGMPTEQWARQVVKDLLKKNPPPIIWRGGSSGLVHLSTILPFGSLDFVSKKLGGIDVVEKKVRG